MVGQPIHQDLKGVVTDICTQSIIEFEAKLQKQKEANEAKARRLKEEENRLKEQILTVEQEERVKLKRVKKVEEECQSIKATLHKLKAKKQVLRDAQRAADIHDDDNNDDGDNDGDDDNSGDSPADGPQVHKYFESST